MQPPLKDTIYFSLKIHKCAQKGVLGRDDTAPHTYWKRTHNFHSTYCRALSPLPFLFLNRIKEGPPEWNRSVAGKEKSNKNSTAEKVVKVTYLESYFGLN